MVREPDATMQPALQDDQLMPKHRVLSLEPHLRLERRGHSGQDETEKSDHSASLGNFIASSTRTHTAPPPRGGLQLVPVDVKNLPGHQCRSIQYNTASITSDTYAPLADA